jgi:hypothetical protein
VAGGGADDAGREDEVAGELLGMVMGKPAAEHSETTKLETAVLRVSIGFHSMVY